MLKTCSKLRRNRYLLGLIYITANKAKYSDKEMPKNTEAYWNAPYRQKLEQLWQINGTPLDYNHED